MAAGIEHAGVVVTVLFDGAHDITAGDDTDELLLVIDDQQPFVTDQLWITRGDSVGQLDQGHGGGNSGEPTIHYFADAHHGERIDAVFAHHMESAARDLFREYRSAQQQYRDAIG